MTPSNSRLLLFNSLATYQHKANAVWYNQSMHYYSYLENFLGNILISASNTHITGVSFNRSPLPDSSYQPKHPLLKEAKEQLTAYFNQQLQCFSLPVAYAGSHFQIAVQRLLASIPFGTTWTYGQVATALNKPTASRAVGGACGRNPVAIIVPCHRVIGKNNTLTGFNGGIDKKKSLLAIEGLSLC